GSYDKREDFAKLEQYIRQRVQSTPVAIECTTWPYAFLVHARGHSFEIGVLQSYQQGWSRHLSNLFTEDQVYRIDHYLGKEMVQNVVVLPVCLIGFWRHCGIGIILLTCWSRKLWHGGRGGYFDEFGIIRDVMMQNHLLQVLSLIAMEKPLSMAADDIRDEKTSSSGNTLPIRKQANPVTLTTHCTSRVAGATYGMAALYIKNERWDGVPFIIRAGKALNETKCEVRIQFKDVSGDIFESGVVHPKRAWVFGAEETELDLSYSKRFSKVKLPDAYERLLLDVLCGSQVNFVRTDELREAWRIFTPILHELDAKAVKPLPYAYGARKRAP
uniref:glucose-6-phosphate dehydrogenase (NADP(+)) n=1 Tax=Macrostomum lignano TaxID=282301 RepID=A0A1I8F9D8_9PLAT